jgi:4'-phosphopantetheinyl transferase
LAEWSAHEQRLREVLSADEQDRADRYRRAVDRQRAIVGRGVARILAGRYLGVRPDELNVEAGKAGKPYVAGLTTPFGFSVSHSGAWVLVAAARTPDVGVDVERHRADLDAMDLAAHVFSRWEQAVLQRQPPELRERLFFDIWARKEAVIKADGAGVGFGLDRFDVEFRPRRAPRVRWMGGEKAGQWTLQALTLDADHAAAVACRGKDVSVTTRRLSL